MLVIVVAACPASTSGRREGHHRCEENPRRRPSSTASGWGRLIVGDRPTRGIAAVSVGIDAPIRPVSDEVSREQTRIDAASHRLISSEPFPILTADPCDGPAWGSLGVLFLRCERSAAIAVTGPNMF